MTRVTKKGGASRKRYAPEFKKAVLALADRDGVGEAAEQLGVAQAQVSPFAIFRPLGFRHIQASSRGRFSA